MCIHIDLYAYQLSHSLESDSATPWTAAHQACLSITSYQSLLKLMCIKLVMPSNHLILQFFSAIWKLVTKMIIHLKLPSMCLLRAKAFSFKTTTWLSQEINVILHKNTSKHKSSFKFPYCHQNALQSCSVCVRDIQSPVQGSTLLLAASSPCLLYPRAGPLSVAESHDLDILSNPANCLADGECLLIWMFLIPTSWLYQVEHSLEE